MEWLHYVSYFFGGMFLANFVPHFVAGLMGRPFQSPFAKPPGRGLSSSTVNVAWGFLNLVVSYFLVCKVGQFDLHALEHSACLGLGMLAISIPMSIHFGQFHGGDLKSGVASSGS
jgi:hypothetical protein